MSIHRYQIVVHGDDCAAVEAEMCDFGYRRSDSSGSLIVFAGARDGISAPVLLDRLRTRHRPGLRVGPHQLLSPARIIRGVGPPRPAPSGLPDFEGRPSGLKVGVIDTGVVLRDGKPHPFLRGRILFTDGDVDPEGRPDQAESDGHGTFVAGVVLGQAPTVTVQMKGVIDQSTNRWEDNAVAKAIRELRDEVDLINLSFTGDRGEDRTPQPIVEALKELGPNVVVVAAGGNGAGTAEAYPAAVRLDQDHPMILAIGAVDEGQPRVLGQLPPIAGFSCRGGWVTAYANGCDVLGPYQDGWSTWSGTSFAAAIVTGRIAATMEQHQVDARSAAQIVLEEAGNHPVDDCGTLKPYVAPAGG
jgi:subtilisin family serine protease